MTVPIATPTDEKGAHPSLWRFRRQVPPRGGVVILDRSWYARVKVHKTIARRLEAALG